MDKFISLVLVLCLGSSLLGQKNHFSGSIMYGDKKNLPCELYIHIDSSYQVSGNLSREVKGNMVRSMISGDFNPQEKTIYLREYARNKADCAILFQGKVYPLIENIYAIAGIFKSLDSQNCPSGHINVICRNFKFNLYPQEVKKPINLSENDEEAILTNLLSQKIKKEANFIQVRENDKVEINAGADTLYLKIYDNQKVDGDRVRIEFNETVVVDNYVLAEEQMVFKLLPKRGKNILKILAINEGKIALNTSKVELYNRVLHDYYLNVLSKNQHAQYEINN